MNKLRAFLIVVVSLGFILSVQGAILSWSIIPEVTNRENLKQTVSSRESYESFIVSVQNNQRSFLQPNNVISTTDRNQFSEDKNTLFNSIEKVITYEKYQKLSKSVVDATFDWLEGKTEKPDFQIVVADSKEQTIKILEPVFIKRFEKLPKCPSSYQLKADFSPLSTECRPDGISASSVSTYLKESATDPDFEDLFESVSFDSQELEITEQQTQIARQTYNWSVLAPIAFTILVVALGVWLATLTKTIPSALKVVGISLVIAAAPTLIGALTFRYLPEVGFGLVNSLLNSSLVAGGFAQTVTLKIVNSIILLSLLGLVLGLVMIIGSFWARRRKKNRNIYQDKERLDSDYREMNIR